LVVPREKHPVSRRDIDSDALRVLYRLQQHKHVAYLVGGSVRDLMLGRAPKDFDIGTDAHPYQIKKLFRNCWIIGRRFRLAHIKFGTKTIEVATFRKNITDLAAAEALADAAPEVVLAASSSPEGAAGSGRPSGPEGSLVWIPADHHTSGGPDEEVRDAGPGLLHRDNTFGTPEEDAFRRDFTVNALFYDVASKTVIDYVGGLEDLERRVIRSIGNPHIRFAEDPVRMFRAAVLGARLGFDLDPLVIEAIAEGRQLITKASAARMLEEYFKVLRSGYAEASFRALARVRLLELITPELKSPSDAFWDSLSALDRYRRRFPSSPPELTNAVLVGSLLLPIGALNRRLPERGQTGVRAGSDRGQTAWPEERVTFGALPVARKDLDRMRQVIQTLPRLSDPALPPRVVKGLPSRPSFADSLTWLEVFGDDPATVERWKAAHAERGPAERHGRPQGRRDHPPQAQGHPAADGGEGQPPRRRRRRRRRGRGPRVPQT